MNKESYYQSVGRSETLIRNYFARHSRDPEEISDLTQEAVAALLDAQRRYNGTCTFTTWVYSVCRNVYRQHVYYQIRRRRIEESLKQNYVAPAESPGDAPFEICAALEALDPADRQLYRLYYVERRSVAEVATILARTEGTTKWILHRLRRRIRDALLGPTDN